MISSISATASTTISSIDMGTNDNVIMNHSHSSNDTRRRRQQTTVSSTVINPKMVPTYISLVSSTCIVNTLYLCLLLVVVRVPDVVEGNSYVSSYNQQRKQRNCFAFQQQPTLTQKQQRNVVTTITTPPTARRIQQQNQQEQTMSVLHMSFSTNSAPSDYDTEEWLERSKKIGVVQVVATSSSDNNDNDDSKEQSDDSTIRDALKNELLLLSAITNRGEYATIDEQNLLIDIVAQLEALNPTINPATNILLVDGIWDLCLSSTQLFRSSPFFQSIRSILQELVDNSNSGATAGTNLFNFNSNSIKATIDTAFDIHDRATTASRIGRVRQIIDYSTAGTTNNNDVGVGLITSEVDLEVGIVPGLPFRVKGTVITTAQIMSSLQPNDDDTIELQIVSTSIRNSNIPIINQFLSDSSSSTGTTNAAVGRSSSSTGTTGTTNTDDSISTIFNNILGTITGNSNNNNNNIQLSIPNEIPVGQLYQTIFGRIPTIQLKTFYLDDTMRIIRDQDDNFFIYTRA